MRAVRQDCTVRSSAPLALCPPSLRGPHSPPRRPPGHMHRVGVTQQIVQIAEDFLICAHQEYRQAITIASVRVQRQDLLDVVKIDEAVHLAV